MGSPVLELDARAGHCVLDRPRHQYFVRRSERTDASADMDGDPAEIVAQGLTFPQMDSRPHLQIEV